MDKITGSDVLQNDVLCGLMGKQCRCTDHHPLEHFKIYEGNQEVTVDLKINGVEVKNAAGFLQAYFRQMEFVIAQRVRTALAEIKANENKEDWVDPAEED